MTNKHGKCMYLKRSNVAWHNTCKYLSSLKRFPIYFNRDYSGMHKEGKDDENPVLNNATFACVKLEQSYQYMPTHPGSYGVLPNLCCIPSHNNLDLLTIVIFSYQLSKCLHSIWANIEGQIDLALGLLAKNDYNNGVMQKKLAVKYRASDGYDEATTFSNTNN